MRLLAPFLLALATGSIAVPAGFEDEGDRESLLVAVERQTAYLEGLKKPNLPFGTASVAVERLKRTNREFGKLVREAWGTEEFGKRLEARFERIDAGPTHFTGYYLPKLEARLAPDARFRYPLYRKPARTTFPTHAEIEDGGALASQGLEVAWVSDEFERYILMVQGSGVLRFGDGQERFINYGGKNGHPYVSLGKALIADGKLATESVSIPAIKRYFAQFPEQQHGYLLRNPSYVFFQLKDEGPFGVDSIELTGRRS
ncbi:MAG: MltA domain-containing protein, partial [Candidatus Sericytochromatia bacterium]|nr:MltA domain-containing protein [Candidatus Tanganyikabacteria bacterium]